MASFKLYLDIRSPRKDGTAPLKIAVNHRGRFMINLKVYTAPANFIDNEVIIPQNPARQKSVNAYIRSRLVYVENTINKFMLLGELQAMTDQQLKNLLDPNAPVKPIKEEHLPLFKEHYEKFIKRRIGNGTISAHSETLKKIARYCDIDSLRFEDITVAWLKEFENYLRNKGLAVNSIARYLRDVRAVYNDAIDYDIVSFASYPFRRFKITHEKTAKRSLTLEQLRTFRDYPCEQAQEQYRDIFMLIFYLCGINIIDLCNLTEIHDGYIEYRRAKTGRLYKIKVEPEAQEILDKYKGKDYLLNILDRYQDYANYRHRLNNHLCSIGPAEIVKDKAGKLRKVKRTPLHPDLSTYWARHTWATIAAELDTPKETIAKALGHSDNSTTDIYIRFDQRKIDAANRKVIDYVNGESNLNV